MYQKFLILCLILFNTLGCQNPHDDGDNSSILAEAFGEQLHISEVSDRLKNIQSASDSQFVINQYTDQWVMDKILYQEAKRTIGKDKGINKLVENYKKSLIIHEWEKTILTEKMDTLLSQNEIDTFYSQRKKDFKY